MTIKRGRSYTNMPVEEVIAVRHAKDSASLPMDYTCVYMKPIIIGKMTQIGARKWVFEDGTEMSTSEAMQQTLLVRAARGVFRDKEVAALSPVVTESVVHVLDGMEMVKIGIWNEFCAMRKMTNDLAALKESYEITQSEAAKLGLNGGRVDSFNKKNPSGL
jgi:hypothetical protein